MTVSSKLPLTIRKAQPEDAAALAPLLVQAMEEFVAEFFPAWPLVQVYPVYEQAIRCSGNQYSYENFLLAEDERGLAGMVGGYDGGMLSQLRQPFLDLVEEKTGRRCIPEDESEPGEFYLDALSVAPGRQGQGIGSLLLGALIEEADSRGFERVGLLVNQENPAALRLYERLGFVHEKKKEVLGSFFFHLVFPTSKLRQLS